MNVNLLSSLDSWMPDGRAAQYHPAYAKENGHLIVSGGATKIASATFKLRCPLTKTHGIGLK